VQSIFQRGDLIGTHPGGQGRLQKPLCDGRSLAVANGSDTDEYDQNECELFH
jgi:hypothetical protein